MLSSEEAACCQALQALGNTWRRSLVGLAGFSLPGMCRCGSNYSTEPGVRQVHLLGDNAAHLEGTLRSAHYSNLCSVSWFLPDIVQSWTREAQVWLTRLKSPGLMNFQLW